ncbi:MAG TPA: biotin--[acetyl-CoA-carboxylase] ligase [Anaerolineaceae bacterium]|nr:biotin--[acetyl-CoA-carboxylase] ligase [Anaerolineaceae bacterium]
MINKSSQVGNWINLAGYDVFVLEETGSTNDDAKNYSGQIADEFVVWAKHQTAGRGREDRYWQATEGCSLTFSVLLRPIEKEKEFLSRFTTLGALALTDLLSSAYALDAEIKWPNDVLIREKKVSGILTEITWRGSSIESIILGIGINLKDRAFTNAGKLRFPATSLEAEGINIESMQTLLEKLLAALQLRRQQLGSAQFLDDWNQKLAFKDKFMPIKQYQGKTEMLCPGSINPDGSLNARDQAGNWRVVHSAEFSASSIISSSTSSSSTEDCSS